MGDFLVAAEEKGDVSVVASFHAFGAEIEIIASEETAPDERSIARSRGSLREWPFPVSIDEAVETAFEVGGVAFGSAGSTFVFLKSIEFVDLDVPTNGWAYLIEFYQVEGPIYRAVVLLDGSALPMRLKKHPDKVFKRLDPPTVDMIWRSLRD